MATFPNRFDPALALEVGSVKLDTCFAGAISRSAIPLALTSSWNTASPPRCAYRIWSLRDDAVVPSIPADASASVRPPELGAPDKPMVIPLLTRL
ncbi:hypothetical protein KXS07_36710 [Inquilinus limosus]|uniref:hypothetical protein n=1 Tax=Inquilinus limosus TaxID=171674 RepID=UPI003F17503B